MVDVSVIMAVYNTCSKNILYTAITSILKQSYLNLELIICDDGSIDDTYVLLEEICRCDPRIILIKNERNYKAGYARNKGIKQAKGRYIAIMDADDYSSVDRIKLQYEYLENNPKVAFVGCKGIYFKNKIGDMEEEYVFYDKPTKYDFLFTLPFVHASLMFRKVVLDKVNGYDENKLVYRIEDYDLLTRLYQNSYYGVNLSSVVYYIRIDENTYARRKYRYRINEALVKLRAFKRLNMLPLGLIYAIKPLIVGLIPIRILRLMQSKYYSKKTIKLDD